MADCKSCSENDSQGIALIKRTSVILITSLEIKYWTTTTHNSFHLNKKEMHFISSLIQNEALKFQKAVFYSIYSETFVRHFYSGQTWVTSFFCPNKCYEASKRLGKLQHWPYFIFLMSKKNFDLTAFGLNHVINTGAGAEWL